MSYLIPEIYFNGLKPIAYTDFIKIYLSSSLSTTEQEVARKHESCHIWLNHHLRIKRLLQEKKTLNQHLLNIALDMEIAKYFYTDEDEKIITIPRGLLNGGVTRKDCEKYPDCKYAEDFYEELLKNQFETKNVFFNDCVNLDNLPEELPTEAISSSSISEILEKTKDKIKELEKVTQYKALNKDYKIKVNNVKPSAASILDATIGRRYYKATVNSYRRPSKIENSDFLKKGKLRISRPPKLTLYIDRSGSFDSSKTSQATSKISNLLLKYRGKLEKDVFYFNNTLLVDDPKHGSGGTNYQCVVNHIKDSNSELSIIITDNDPCNITVPSNLGKILIIPIGCIQTEIGKKVSCHEINI